MVSVYFVTDDVILVLKCMSTYTNKVQILNWNMKHRTLMVNLKKKSEKLVAWPVVRKIAFFHLLRQIIVQPLFSYCKITLADSLRNVNRKR